jgi:hypothetical protein
MTVLNEKARTIKVNMTIKKYMYKFVTGKQNQMTYSKLKNAINHQLQLDGIDYKFKTKDELRAHMNKIYDYSNWTLVSTATGVFVASTKQEIEECALRIRRHALGELRRYAKLMKLPNDYQMLIDFENDKLRYVDRWQQQRLFDLDSELFEISKEREKNV